MTIKKLSLKIKLVLMTIILALLPFASTFAVCSCNGKDESVTTKVNDPESVQIQTRVQTQVNNLTAQAEAASTDAVSDASMASDSPYLNSSY